MGAIGNYFQSRRSPDQFTTFAILYMIPMMHELGYPWWSWGGQNPPFLLQGLILAALLATGLNVNLAAMLFLTMFSTSYYLITSFPENPNHITLLIFCNIAILVSLTVLIVRMKSPRSRDEIFAALKPVMRLILIALLFVAGFHKFNTDFLNPEVSCVKMILGLLEARASRHIFGIPLFVIAIPVLAAFGYFSFSKYLHTGVNTKAPGLAFLAIIILAVCAGLFLSKGDLFYTVVGAGAVIVLVWQLIEGPLLFVRRLQGPILLISLLLLGIIAASGVQMFPAVLLPLLFVFVPDHIFFSWRSRSLLSAGQWKVHSIYVCLFLNFFGALATYINESVASAYNTNILPQGVSDVLFLLSIALLLKPLVGELLSGDRKWRWDGVEIWNSKTPAILLIFPIMVLLWGMTPYLGLRTAGNFSMFSNLKTEGPFSNHIMFGSNPIKIWGYQEDRVRIIEIDEIQADAGHHYEPLSGSTLPVVEFRKLVAIWRESGNKVAMTYEYQSGPVRTADVANDPNWATAGRNWETFWLDFRQVQESGPNLCRW